MVTSMKPYSKHWWASYYYDVIIGLFPRVYVTISAIVGYIIRYNNADGGKKKMTI